MQQSCSVVFLFPLLLTQCALWVRGGKVLFCGIETSVLHLYSAQHPCSNPALRAAAAEGGALCSRFFAPAPLQNETIDYNKKDTHRTALFPNPAPARSAVKRTASVTTGHQAAQRSNHLRSKGRRTATRKPAAKALFFFSTVHGALLFLRARRKRRGGCISNKRDVGAFPNKRMVFQKERRNPISKRAPLPGAQPRQKRRARPTGHSLPRQGDKPAGRGMRPP